MAMTSETKVALALVLLAGGASAYYLLRKRQSNQGAQPSGDPSSPPSGDMTQKFKTPASSPLGSDKALDNLQSPDAQKTPSAPASDPFAQAPVRASRQDRFRMIPASMRPVPAGAHSVSVPAGTWWWMEDGGLFDAASGNLTNINAEGSGVVLTLHAPSGSIVKVPIGAVLNTISGSLKLPVPAD
jgi:hypothetical protein